MVKVSARVRLTRFLSLICTIPFIFGCALTQDSPVDNTRIKLGFGSCLHQDFPQPIWESVFSEELDAFVFLGDNYYAKTLDENVLKEVNRKFRDNPSFRKLLSDTAVHAVWDDNDRGGPDGGKEYPLQKLSKKLFLNTFEIDGHDPRVNRPGIYYSTYLDKQKQVQLILLDTRSFRDPLRKLPGELKDGVWFYLPHVEHTASILGDEQWNWLTREFNKPARLRIIASSIQFLAHEHGFEHWGNFPHERQRMLDLLSSHGETPAVFISGDRHFGEISCLENTLPYSICDITSSAMNLPAPEYKKVNRYLIPPQVLEPNYGVVEITIPETGHPQLLLAIKDQRGGVKSTHPIRLNY